MRIETTVSNLSPVDGQRRSGVAGMLLLVADSGNRWQQEKFFDQDSSRITRWKIEPFPSTMRPSGLKAKIQKRKRRDSQSFQVLCTGVAATQR